MKNNKDEHISVAFEFSEKYPRMIDLGNNEVYAFYKNKYLELMFDGEGKLLTKDELIEVLQRHISSRGYTKTGELKYERK